MLRSILCYYSDAYMRFMRNISVNNTGTVGAPTNRNKKVIFKNCVPFHYCISKINNTEIDNTQYIDIVMPMYNLTEYSDNYSKATGSLWRYCKEIPAVNNEGKTAEFDGATATDSFNFKTKTSGQNDNNRRIDNVEIMIPLKRLSNFWRTPEMPLINCEVELILTWSANYVTIYTDVADQNTTSEITETNLSVPVYQLKIMQSYYLN